MNLKRAVIDTLDPRPIKKVTIYALGTAMQGTALGVFLSVAFPGLPNAVRLGAAAVFFIGGAALAVSSYSALKRKYMIVERAAEQEDGRERR